MLPTIAVTTDPATALHPSIPLEYQWRLLDVRDTRGSCGIVSTELDLFEEDFISIADPAHAELYGRGLQAHSSENGVYSADTREQIIQQTFVGGDYYDVSGTAGAVGAGASAPYATFVQLWQTELNDVDLGVLATELAQLRDQLRTDAQTAGDGESVDAVAKAELAARSGDGPGALSWLQKAGKWAFDTATKIGAGVATAAAKTALGL